jgi:hypothetical protein
LRHSKSTILGRPEDDCDFETSARLRAGGYCGYWMVEVEVDANDG